MSNRGRHKKSNQHLIVQILGKSIANRMMECQREQGNQPNLDVFLHTPTVGGRTGFVWCKTVEGHYYWDNLIIDKLIKHPLYKKWKNDWR